MLLVGLIMSKELYEPLWDELYARLKARNIYLGGVWIADAAHQGVSGVLNEEKVGNDRMSTQFMHFRLATSCCLERLDHCTLDMS